MLNSVKLIFFFCFILFFAQAEALTIKSKFTHAEKGDFIVCEGRGSLSLIFVKSCDPKTIIIEEISFPKSSKPKKLGSSSWQEWLNQGAPGHTSWVAIEVDLTDTGIMECFSYSRDAWIALTSGDSFLIHLFDLTLHKVPDYELSKIGPPPEKGPDNRKTWNPPLIIEGKRQSNRAFDVFRIEWPKDDSPLSNKQVEVYFNQKDKLFPFPYLFRIRDTNHLSLAFHALDSGKGLISPKGDLPRRAFFLTRTNFNKEDQIELELSAPLYYKKFNLQALDSTEFPQTSTTIPYELHREGEKVTIKIEKAVLQKKLNRDHLYSFSLSTDLPAPVSVQPRELYSP